MKVLLTGAAGQVGRAVLASAPAGVDLRAVTHAELDIADRDAVHAAVAAFRPDVLINAAAYTAVDKAESEPELAHAINAAAPRHLAEALVAVGHGRMLHISTDYVFDGESSSPYKPDDATSPLGAYGHTKLEGEQAVQRLLSERAATVRTAWVYAPQGRNFLLTMLRLMRERGTVRVVADQWGTPTCAVSVARALWRLTSLPGVSGLLHWTDNGATTWHGFASAIADEAQVLQLLPQGVQVLPIGTADYPTPARRPARSVLNTDSSAEKLGIHPVAWRDNLRATLLELASSPIQS